ncbi:hypothetical protein [Flavobacterium hungaricum]|uniref:Uncharacterized protein n=1 Tax=Flavobacterium hungaricum TaxID=2082725 RepID=A0ABR9TRC1_9FLAO|nr:hypothetical protein [Flavobacterium hungaricum]MBE8727314.1 hypothetical protein [Flavobacterium hungaricum]
MKLSTDIKYFTIKQNAVFLLVSLFLVWIWMFIASKYDRENDRGLMTSFGYTIILCFILVKFFAQQKSGQYLATFFHLVVGWFAVFLLTLTLGSVISIIIKASWAWFLVPLFSTTVLLYFILRRLFSFADNFIAFWVLFTLPILTAVTLKLLPFYDDIIKYELGIGFPISIYLSSVFIAIAILCKKPSEE